MNWEYVILNNMGEQIMEANYVIKVDDLELTRTLYHNLNFKEKFYDDHKGIVFLVSPDYDKWRQGSYLLILNKDVDFSPYVTEKYTELSPGDRTYCEVNNLPRLLEQIDSHLTNMVSRLNSYKWGSHDCTISIPGGYKLILWEQPNWKDDELLKYYKELPNYLERSLHDLSDSQLNLARAEGKWSIKQNAFHLMDSHLSFPIRVKFALAESGRTWIGNVYDQDKWAVQLDYANRNLDAELNYFKAAVENVIILNEHFSSSLDRYIVVNGSKSTIRDMLKLITLHSLGHIERIWETRDTHKIEQYSVR